MNKKITLGLAISLIAIGCAITFVLTWAVSLNSYNKKIADTEKYEGVYQKLKEMDATVQANYIGELDRDELEAAIIKGYVSGIGDKYAAYMTPDIYRDYQQKNSGTVTGAGFEAEEDGSGYLKITKVYEGSSAEGAGITAGDIITEINGKSLLSMTGDSALKRISGEVGTKLSIRVVRNGEEQSATLLRQQIDVQSVSYKLVRAKLGYIRITAFNAKTPEQFSEALNSLTSRGAEAFIFDVRQTDGALISAVKPMINRLIPAAAAATAEYANGVRKTLIETDSEESVTKPIMILVDGGTASAAELFAVTLRDEQGAQLCGVQTAGRSVLQSTYEFSDGSALTLTTATIIPSKSDKYDGVGLKPDYITEFPANTSLETVSQDADTQLQKAIEVLISKLESGSVPDVKPTPTPSNSNSNSTSNNSGDSNDSGDSSDSGNSNESNNSGNSNDDSSAESADNSESN